MEKTGGSRLLQMQARFQQKQMAEREMKIASLYEAQQARALTRVRHSPVSPATPANVVTSPQSLQVQPGKVRQMFEERRTKGIDKSYPLKPINNNTVSRQVNGHSKTTATTASSSNKLSVSEKKMVKTNVASHSLVRKQKLDNVVNGSRDLNHNHELGPRGARAGPPLTKHAVVSADETDGYRLEDETFPEALAPAQTPRDTPPPPAHIQKTPVKVNGVVTAKTPALRRPAHAPSISEATPTTGSDTGKARVDTMQRTANPAPVQQKRSSTQVVNSASSLKAKPTAGSKQTPRASSSAPTEGVAGAGAGAGAGEGAPCAVCGRRFAADRLDKHQTICKKAHAKKRKPFDALKHRLAGTEAEPFIMRVRRSGGGGAAAAAGAGGGAGAGAGGGAGAGAGGKASNSNWRQKHEDFIRAIRAAKQVQAHLNAGGKLSELPPPPPSENPDYVSCPSCKRRFNRAAADRHIPKCASYQFNKPKAQPAKRR